MHKCLIILFAACIAAAPAMAMDPLYVATKVAERPANEGRVATMVFKMVNKAGRTRNRQALMAHAEGQALTKVAIYFTAPAAIEETAFLSYDRPGTGPDENWLYLPATQKVRRLPPSDRGDYFLGTDLTYGDIKDNFKFKLEDWTFQSAVKETRNGKSGYRLIGTAASPEAAKEMGYSQFSAFIDPVSWFPLDVTYADVEGDALKSVRVEDVQQVGGAWTAMKFSVDHHQSGHNTFVHFEDMRHVPGLDQAVFDPDALSFGVPDIES